MNPLELAMAGSGIFSGVGDAINSGSTAGQQQLINQMRTKEIIGGVLVGTVGMVFAFKERSVLPLLVAVGVISLLIFLHEYHAAKNAPAPDPNLHLVGSFK